MMALHLAFLPKDYQTDYQTEYSKVYPDLDFRSVSH
jgi:hypothetical protein